ncbi:hypothetical protein [Mycolicibacterium setense]|nr:hypothetical protein [Mycolicibacterium setense]
MWMNSALGVGATNGLEWIRKRILASSELNFEHAWVVPAGTC